MNGRLTKFFNYNKQMQPGAECFRPRKEPDYSHPETYILPNCLVIYGVGFAKLKTLLKRFSPEETQYLNESNRLFKFAGEEQAWMALSSNMADPTSLVRKQESEEEVLPRGWFELKPYIDREREVKLWARFAASSDIPQDAESEKVERQKRLDVYLDSKAIFNRQEEERKRLEAERDELFKERKTINKQRNTERLYDQYQQDNEEMWKTGTNENPGAHRERSRSRSKEKEEKIDDGSNCSFVLRKKENELTKKVGELQLSDPVQMAPEEEDKVSHKSKESQSQKDGEQAQYNWRGSGA